MVVKENPNRKKKCNSKLPQSCHRDIFNFWLQKSQSLKTDSTNNLKRLPEKTFLQQHKFIVDANLMEKTVQLKNRSKIMYMAHKMIYIESI